MRERNRSDSPGQNPTEIPGKLDENPSESPGQPEPSGKARGAIILAQNMTAEERKARASKAAKERWARKDRPVPVVASHKIPVAVYRGVLNLVGVDLPCYVLDNGVHVVSRTAFIEMITGIKEGGGFKKYLSVSALKPFINADSIEEALVEFKIPEVEGIADSVKGMPDDLVIELCRGFVSALEASVVEPEKHKLTHRQAEMAIKANSILSACAKVGLTALIDEATGYQYDRARDALQVKLKAYLEEEMRKWEPTFPEELWVEFARLTNWKGTVTKRPKYWGKLVMELVYEYLDRDVAKWLKDNAPAPRHGQNYHQWLSAQYGLKKLVEHIWTLVGVARTCHTMLELREKMAALNGRSMVQLFLPVPHAPRAPGPTAYSD